MDIQELLNEMELDEIQLLGQYSNKIQRIKDYLIKSDNELLDIRFSQNEGLVGIVKNKIVTNIPLSKDKDGLCYWDDLYSNIHYIGGYFVFDDFYLKLTKYLKINYSNQYSYFDEFISDFYAIDRNKVKARICLDDFEFRIDEPQPIILANLHYGTKFNSNILEIPDGVTKLKSDDIDLTINDINRFKRLFEYNYALDVKFSTKGNIRTIQLLEYKFEEVYIIENNMKKYPVKYIHAEFDIEKNSFQHFDGAIHFYEEKHYFARRDQNFNYDYRSKQKQKALSKKIFRLDGVILIDVWCKLTVNFFNKNPLLQEYFTGEYPQYIRKLLKENKT